MDEALKLMGLRHLTTIGDIAEVGLFRWQDLIFGIDVRKNPCRIGRRPSSTARLQPLFSRSTWATCGRELE